MNPDSDTQSRQIEYNRCNMTSLLSVYVVFGPILHILIIQYQDAVCLQQLLL